MRLFFIFSFLYCFQANAQNLNWVAEDSLADNGFHFGMGVAHDAYDNVYTTSVFRPSAGFTTPWGSYISKRDNAGNLLWRKFYYWVEAWGLDCDPTGNVYLSGVFCKQGNLGCGILEDSSAIRTCFVAKLDPSGNCQWSHMIKKAVGSKIAYNQSDNTLYVIGKYYTGVQFDTITIPSPIGQFLAKYSINGEFEWVVPLSNEKHVCNLAVNDNYVSITGTYAFDLHIGIDSSLATLGQPYPISDEIHNAYTALFDHSGNFKWARTTVVAKYDGESNSITLDDQNNVYVTGIYNDSAKIAGRDFVCLNFSDPFIVKYNELGDTVKVVTFPGYGPVEGRAIHATSSGIYFAGGGAGQVTIADTTITPPSSSILLAKLNFDLDHVDWIRMYSSPGGDHSEIFKIISDNQNNIIACGDYTTSLQVDNQLLYYGRGHFKKPFVLSLSENASTGFITTPALSSISLYPNPSKGIFHLVFSYNRPIGKYFIEIRNQKSQLIKVFSGETNNASFDELIDLSSQPKGIYFVNVMVNGKRDTKKIILN
jgi:hypothetical protein